MVEIQRTNEELQKAKPAAKAIGCSASALYRKAKRGEAPCYRFGKALRFDVTELRLWMREQALKKEDGVEAGR